MFERWDPLAGKTAVFIANADGTDVRQLFGDGAEMPHWSPDAKTVSIFCCDNGNAAHLVDVASGSLREFPPPDPAIEVHCGPWSADGSQLLCESFGVADPKLNGVYAMSAVSGKDLIRLTENPDGDDSPGSYSPDGSQMVFDRTEPASDLAALFVTNLQDEVRRITPLGSVNLGFFGRYSPDGMWILFASAEDGGLWVVRPDGSQLHEVFHDAQDRWAVTPTWSPDGTMIMFALAPSANLSEHPLTGMYVIDADGGNLTEVLPPDAYQSNPDWAS